MRGPTTCVLFILAMCCPAMAQASTWQVPAHCPTIQAGVDSASVGDSVLVGPGTYTERVNIPRGGVVRSVAGADSTTIDAAGLGTTVKVRVETDKPEAMDGSQTIV